MSDDAICDQVAEAVEALLIAANKKQAFGKGVTFATVLQDAPVFDQSAGYYDTLRVTIIPPAEVTMTREDDGTWQDTLQVFIGVEKKLPDTNRTTLKPYKRIGERIAKYEGFETLTLADGRTAFLIERAHVPHDMEALLNDSMFAAAIRLTYYVSMD